MGAGQGIGSLVGAGVGTLIMPGVGTAIGAGLGGQLGGAIQAGSGSGAPSYNQTYLDSGTQGLLGKQATQAQTKTASDYGNQFMGGTNAGANTANGAAGAIAIQNQQGGGYGTADMSAAIKNKSAANFSRSAAQLNNNAQLQGVQSQMSYVNNATNTDVSMANYARGVQSKIDTLNMQADADRSKIIGGVLGSMGQFGGAAAGGLFNGQTPMTTGSPMQWAGGGSGAGTAMSGMMVG